MFDDFKIQIEGPFDYKIVCDNSDERNLSLFIQKVQTSPFDENILVSNPKKQREYEQNRTEWLNSRNQKKPAGQILFDPEDSIDVEHKLIKSNQKGAEIKQIISSPEKPQALARDIEFDGNDIEIKVTFMTRLARDAFVIAIRILTAVRSIVLSPLIDNTEKVFRRQFDMTSVLKDREHSEIVDQMVEFGGSVKRVVQINKNLDKLNSQFNSCIEALEEDIEQAFSEIKSMIDAERLNFGKGKASESLRQVQKSILETSMHLADMKKGAQASQVENKKFQSTRKADVQKFDELEKELEHTNKLNDMLLKSINQIKVKQLGQGDSGLRGLGIIGNGLDIIPSDLKEPILAEERVRQNDVSKDGAKLAMITGLKSENLDIEVSAQKRC